MQMKPLLMKAEDGEQCFAKAILQIVKRRGVNILVIGETQQRKSTTAISLSYQLAPERFELEKHCVVIDGNKFLELIESPEKNDLQRGDVVIADDFGISASARSWYSKLNKMLNQNLQVLGRLGLIIIVTVPFESFLDCNVRKLFDFEIVAGDPDENNRLSNVEIKKRKMMPVADKIVTYRSFPRLVYPDGRIMIIDSFQFRFPRKEIMDRYYAMAEKAKQEVSKNTRNEREEMSAEKNQRFLDVNKCVEEMKPEFNKFIKLYHGTKIINVHAIRNHFHVGLLGAKRIQSKAEEIFKKEIENAEV